MRKLPVFFLIDLSESMVGEPIELVRKGMEHLIRGLKRNPFALETVWIEILGFAGKPKVVEPFEELPLFYPPNFPIGGGTAIGEGLELLMKEIDSNVKKNSPDRKGDWKPLVFIFTDGQPTDEYGTSLKKWQSNYKQRCQTLMATLGEVVTTDFIYSIADDAIKIEDCSENSFESYFKWLTDSIVKSSIQVSEGIEPTGEGGELDAGISKINLDKRPANADVDDNFLVLLGACQQTEEKYLIKYKKGVEVFGGNSDNFDKVYRLEGAYKIDYKIYKELSSEDVNNNIDTRYLRGVPSCPHCGSKHAVAVCACGGIFCVDVNSNEQTCAWCGITAFYGVAEGDFSINRRQG
jgi:uncharacterized protein YegL